METIYAIAAALALAGWFLAAILYVAGWQRGKKGYNQAGDGLALVGLVAALVGLLWLAWRAPLTSAFTRTSLASGLAVLMVVVYGLLAYSRPERLSALATLGLAVPLQADAVGRLWWGIDGATTDVFLPIWAAASTLVGLAGYASLAVAAIMMVLSFGLSRTQEKFSAEWLTAVAGLRKLVWRAAQIALIAVSLSLATGLARAWWGLGRLMLGGSAPALTTWLLLVASMYAQMQGATSRRPARALLALASLMGILSALAMTG
jgi:hypothetical protein